MYIAYLVCEEVFIIIYLLNYYSRFFTLLQASTFFRGRNFYKRYSSLYFDLVVSSLNITITAETSVRTAIVGIIVQLDITD
jgi:hypothetical protein